MSGVHRIQMIVRIYNFNTYHVVRNQFQVPDIDLDAVDAKHATYLSYDSRAGHLYTVCGKDGVDVIGVNVILLDQRFLGRTCKLPKPTEVRAIGCNLQRLWLSTVAP
jgi:hypothetical protein